MLERQIDTLSDRLPKLHNFVVAGGNITGAQCHVCRTVCRRAERRVVTLVTQTINQSGTQTIKQSTDTIQRYLNRLSDYLFVLSRYAVVSSGNTEDLYIN